MEYVEDKPNSYKDKILYLIFYYIEYFMNNILIFKLYNASHGYLDTANICQPLSLTVSSRIVAVDKQHASEPPNSFKDESTRWAYIIWSFLSTCVPLKGIKILPCKLNLVIFLFCIMWSAQATSCVFNLFAISSGSNGIDVFHCEKRG